jgi:hypothetical protein
MNVQDEDPRSPSTTGRPVPWIAVLVVGLAVALAAPVPVPVPTPAELAAPYDQLLQNEKLTAAMVWEGEDGPVPYADWPPRRRAELSRSVRTLAAPDGDRPATGKPPAAAGDGTGPLLTPDRAWAVYLNHVAHALWLEVDHRLPWSLLSFTSDQLALLLDARELLAYLPDRKRYAFGPAGDVADRDAGWGQRFMLSQELLGPSQEETIWALGGWLRRRVEYPAEPPLPHEGKSELRGLPDVLAPATGAPPRVADCHELAGVMVALLRSVNVPAAARRTLLSLPGSEPSEHSRVALPTVGRGTADASVLAMPLLRPSGNVVPTSALFPTLGWIAENVSHPRDLDCRGEVCHGDAEQALYNMARRSMALAVSHLPDGLLIKRAGDAGPDAPAPATEALLSGRLETWGGGEFVKPFFEAAERRAIVRRIDTEIERIGEGDWQLGAERVRRRWLAAQPGDVETADEPSPLSPPRRNGRAAAPGDPASPTGDGSTTMPRSRSPSRPGPTPETEPVVEAPPDDPDG